MSVKKVLHIAGNMDAGGAETVIMNINRNIDTDKLRFDFAVEKNTEGFYAQEIKKDTLQKEQNVEGVVIKASGNKISETAILGDQKKEINQKQSMGAEEISRKGISNVEQGLV